MAYADFDSAAEMMREHSTLYLGVLLAFMCPVLAFQWFTFGHFIRWKASPWLTAIVVQVSELCLVCSGRSSPQPTVLCLLC